MYDSFFGGGVVKCHHVAFFLFLVGLESSDNMGMVWWVELIKVFPQFYRDAEFLIGSRGNIVVPLLEIGE